MKLTKNMKVGDIYLNPLMCDLWILRKDIYEDEEIHIHDTTTGNELAFSYNKKLLQQWRNEDIKHTIHKLEKRLKELSRRVK